MYTGIIIRSSITEKSDDYFWVYHAQRTHDASTGGCIFISSLIIQTNQSFPAFTALLILCFGRNKYAGEKELLR